LTSRRFLTPASLYAALLFAALASLLLATRGGATALPVRTLLASTPPDGGAADGASRNPVLSTTGRVIAFDTTATNLGIPDLNGGVRDVFVSDLVNGERRLVSAPSATLAADGPSSGPVISRDGQRVVFVSEATNLAAADTNGVSDVFYRDGRGPIERVSVGLGGSAPNRASAQPDVSADGRFVVFTSAATNLVPNDTNGQPDVFMRDLTAGYTARISISSTGAQGNAPSDTPAISANARVVSFASRASNLVRRDTNRVGDVFVRVPGSRRTERVSVSSRGRQQNRAVVAPFTQISDVSRDGQIVVFESDATNLVRPDTNRHTDVFRHDRRTKRTTLISVDSLGFQGNNDSFAPTITPSGRFVSFQSFSTNLARGGGPREDIFLRDLLRGTTSVVNVPANGGTRAPELVAQLLQRPSISNNGTIAAFSSTAPNLVQSDANESEDVFVRLLAAPRGRSTRAPRPGRRPVVYLGADDPQATEFVCRVDDLSPFACRAGEVRLPRGLSPGRHTLNARAGGPGMLYDPIALRIRVRVTRGG
jgi:Tol biopolymer transport system component